MCKTVPQHVFLYNVNKDGKMGKTLYSERILTCSSLTNVNSGSVFRFRIKITIGPYLY